MEYSRDVDVLYSQQDTIGLVDANTGELIYVVFNADYIPSVDDTIQLADLPEESDTEELVGEIEEHLSEEYLVVDRKFSYVDEGPELADQVNEGQTIVYLDVRPAYERSEVE